MTDRDLIAEGRRLYTAALDAGESRVVLGSEGDTDATTHMLIWAGNNLPALLDRWESDAKLLNHCDHLLGEVMRMLDITNGDDEAILPRLAALKASGGAR